VVEVFPETPETFLFDAYARERAARQRQGR
jgi:hypothetical protein